jgi:hypothetical protein
MTPRASRSAGTAPPALPARLTTLEQNVLAAAEPSLAKGLALKQWFDQALATNTFDEKFDLTLTGYRNERSFGFFGRAPLDDGSLLPVMGNVQEMFFDQQRDPQARPAAIESANRQLREFVLRYFLRATSFVQPEPAAEGILGRTSDSLDESDLDGFGYTQYFYKSAQDGSIGRFPKEERFRIADMRGLGPLYRWILGMVRFWNFRLGGTLPGQLGLGLSVAIPTESYIMFPPEFVIDRPNPEPGVLGEYGVGYAGILDPFQTFVTFGPGHFQAAIQLFNWRVLSTGEIRVRLTFASNRISHATQVTLDPVGWALQVGDAASFGLAAPLFRPLESLWKAAPKPAVTIDPVFGLADIVNRVTGGAARHWPIDRQQFDRNLLYKHFQEHYQAVSGASLTWREVPDWLDERAIPSWVKEGRAI